MKLPGLRGKLLRSHRLAEYTTWKIGGMADYFYQPTDLQDLVTLFEGWQEQPLTLIGGGSNLLVRDRGVEGIVVMLRGCLTEIARVNENTLRVEAGGSLAALVNFCADCGMEAATFLSGIPGSVGGALRMNAGAYGGAIWEYVQSVQLINRAGELLEYDAKDFSFGYRTLEGLPEQVWFVAASLSFPVGDRELAKQRVKEIIQRRNNSQPLDFPSCGSVFRNPRGDYAARLIEANGLKGRRIGGAQISEKHANFILNIDSASSQDVEQLMAEIQTKVYAASGVLLLPEVHVIGRS